MADLHVIEKLFEGIRQSPLVALTFARFKHVWRAHSASYVLLVRTDDEDQSEFMQDLYRGLTNRLDVAADDDEDECKDRIWTIYTLYTLHECQITRRKHKIVLPQSLWSILHECLSSFRDLPLRDPVCVLRDMIRREMFEFHVDFPLANAIAAAQEEASTKNDMVIKEERPNKHRRLLPSSEFDDHLHELADLSSHLQLSQLREMSLSYAQSMHQLQVEDTRHASAAGAATAAGASTAATPADVGMSMIGRRGIHSVVGVPPTPTPTTFSTASFKLLQRVERAIEEQDALIENTKLQMQSQTTQPIDSLAAGASSSPSAADGSLRSRRAAPPDGAVYTPADLRSILLQSNAMHNARNFALSESKSNEPHRYSGAAAAAAAIPRLPLLASASDPATPQTAAAHTNSDIGIAASPLNFSVQAIAAAVAAAKGQAEHTKSQHWPGPGPG